MSNLLSDTVDFMIPFCRYQDAAIGTANMPLVGIASIVRNIILAAPFTWRFNRSNINLTGSITSSAQDYTQTISNFGFLEKGTVTGLDNNGNLTTWEIKDILNNDALAATLTQARPVAVSVFNDNGSSSYTFRFSTVPDQSYQVNLVYQLGPVKFSQLTDGWAPIPDAFSDVYNNLCLGYYMDSCQDPRAGQYISRGIAGLLARAQGLSQMDKAIFAAAYMNFNAAQLAVQGKTQQGIQAQAAR